MNVLNFVSFLLPQFYLHNHLSFILYFHREKLEEGEIHDYRVVRFEVVPQSVKVEGWCHPTPLVMSGKREVGLLTKTKNGCFFFDVPILLCYSFSDLKAEEKLKTCTLPEASGSAPQEIDPTKENEVLFTYSVHWEVSEMMHPVTRVKTRPCG